MVDPLVPDPRLYEMFIGPLIKLHGIPDGLMERERFWSEVWT